MPSAWWRSASVWLLLASSLALACACSSAGRSFDTPTVSLGVAAADTALPCSDETAIRTIRGSVVRISTDVAVGTGIVVAQDQILTNAHVVEGNSRARVESEEGADEGTVVGTDVVVDLALIQAPTHALPAVKFADTSALKPGQRLLAMGYALDLPGEPSNTAGIFSALREKDGVHYVQTDAPINPGNSGGPLFTQCGDVVGLNTSGTLTGIGFAIDASAPRTATWRCPGVERQWLHLHKPRRRRLLRLRRPPQYQTRQRRLSARKVLHLALRDLHRSGGFITPVTLSRSPPTTTRRGALPPTRS